MSLVMTPASEDGDRRERPDESLDERRSRARRNALLLALVAAAIYVGYILYGLLKGIFPG